MELSRRFFLGGAISLLAANTFVPSLGASGNLPRIWGDGKHDDTSGLGALFRKEPVIFSADRIGVEEHSGITIHNGRFVITQTLHLPPGLKCSVMQCEFDAKQLDESFPILQGRHKELRLFFGFPVRFTDKIEVHRALLINPVELPDTEEEIREGEAKLARERAERIVREQYRLRNQTTFAEWERMLPGEIRGRP